MRRPPLRLALGRALGLALALALPPPGWAADDPADEPVQRLKVVYLYNFTRFIAWPDAAVGDAFVIAVLGDADLAEALRALEYGGRRAEGRPIRIRSVDTPAQVSDAQIVFVGTDAVSDLPLLLARTRDKPVLLVGDSPGLARRGVGINFFLQRDILGAEQQLRFEINPAALEKRGLTVMVDLYEVAEIVP